MNLWERLFGEKSSEELDQAQEALARAETAEMAAKEKEREVERLVMDLRRMRLENNFARNIRATVRGRHTA